MRKLIILTFVNLIFTTLVAQDLSEDVKHWYLVRVNGRISKLSTISVGHLSSFDVRGYQHGFTQSNLNFSRKFGQSWTGSVGYAYSEIIRTNKSNTRFSRLQLEVRHRVKWDHLRMQNSLRVEQYFPRLPKYGRRAIISNKWQYYNRKWPLRISPYIKNQLFYYHGGQEVTYWFEEQDIEDGEEAFIRQSPNGWHRYRFTAGVRARLARNLYLSLFYTLQREFNTGLAPFRELNVPNRSGPKTTLRFNNYSLLGMSLSYTFKLY